jgi:hypothetical protein
MALARPSKFKSQSHIRPGQSRGFEAKPGQNITTEEEKEHAKEYVEKVTCPEWWNGFLLADGTKFVLFQKPGLHGEAWFDKNKDYSIDCQVRE